MAKNYIFPKDILDYSVEIDGTDLTGFVIQIDIFQDIFLPYWTASIIFNDTQNMIMHEAISQGAKIKITVQSMEGENRDEEIEEEFEFLLHQISERDLINTQNYLYQLNGISEEYILDQGKRISKHFEEKKFQECAEEIIDGISKLDKVSESELKHTFIVPNLSPIAALEWASKYVFIENKGSDIFVFKSDHNKMSAVSLEEMFDDHSGKLPRLVNKPTNYKLGAEDFINIEQYKFLNHMNVVQNTVMGGYASSYIKHDIVSKKAGTTSYTYGSDNNKDSQKKPFKSFSGYQGLIQANISYQPIHGGVVQGMSLNDTFQQWRGSRKSNILKLESNRLLVDIAGTIGSYSELGKYVDVELPSQQDITDPEEFDEYYSGPYVILAMKHTITPKEFHTTIELGKKRLEKSL